MCCSSPLTIGPKKIRNRFWQTSHCAGPGAERPGAQAHLRGMKAEGGWGAVFTEFCSIHPESDEYPYTSARIWDQGDVINLGYMCEVAHRHGALAGIQLWYSGGNAPSLESREFGRAPSQWLSPIFATRSVYGCEMDELDIRTVINMYVEAGKRAAAAGFDLLEVSAGDDTLPMQFLEPRFNRRTDRLRRQLCQPVAVFHRAAARAEARAWRSLRHHDALRDRHSARAGGRRGPRGRRTNARTVPQ